MSASLPQISRLYLFTQGLMLLALLLIIELDLLPALLGGLLVFFLVEFGAGWLGRFGIIPRKGRYILLFAVASLIITLSALGVMGIIHSLSQGPESMVGLLQSMANTVEAARSHLPDWAGAYLPANIDELQQSASNWLRDNAGHFGTVGQEAGGLLLRLILGIVIGGMVAVDNHTPQRFGPLAQSLAERITILSRAFRRIVFSQVKISGLNTFLTAVFLVIVVPAFGYHLPFIKTMIAVTFFVGLLPIIGNLVSNTVICLVALSVSPYAAMGALVFLVVIHKLEYFVNAHIIGNEIKARSWELLLAMLVMESTFGIPGLIAAPIYYAYLKDELCRQKLL